MDDFTIESMRFTATERRAGILVSSYRALYGTTPNPLEELARMMSRVCTPYGPCSDLPKGPWS
jgi:hypothetical protein